MTGSLARRPVSADDEAFLLDVYGSTRADELALTDWDEAQKDAFVRMQFAAQQAHYRQRYPQASHEILLLDGIPAGRLYMERRADGFHILDLAVHPHHRRRGIGSDVIREMQTAAASAGLPVTVYVETFNTALPLFRRLGFRPVEETGVHYLLEWRPEAPDGRNNDE